MLVQILKKIRPFIVGAFLLLASSTSFAQSVLSTPQGGTGSRITPPTVPGDYLCEFHVVTTPVGITCPQSGMGPRAIIGSTVSTPVLFSDNGSIVEHDATATACLTTSGGLSLPTPATLGNSFFVFSFSNHTPSCTDLVTPAGGYTVNGLSALPVGPSVFCRFSVDPHSSANWLGDCSNASSGAASPFVVLTDGATINWPVSGLSSNAEVTIAGNRSLSISGATSGWSGVLFVTQGSGGSHTITLPAGFYVEGGGAGTISLSSVAGRVDRLQLFYDGTNFYADAPHLNFTASAGGATFTLIERQHTTGSCSAGLQLNLGTSTTAGELIALSYFGGLSGGSIAISDSASETYTKVGELTNIGSHYATGAAYFLTAASGVTWVKITGTGDGSCGLVAEHWTRSTGSWAIDQTGAASATGQSTPWASPARTTTTANELLFGYAFADYASGTQCVLAASGAWTGTRATDTSNNRDSIMLDQNVSSIQTNIQATGTTTGCTGNVNYPGIFTVK